MHTVLIQVAVKIESLQAKQIRSAEKRSGVQFM